MCYASKVREHETAALREADAAMRATCKQDARLHAALANMHRHEAAKMECVRQVLRVSLSR